MSLGAMFATGVSAALIKKVAGALLENYNADKAIIDKLGILMPKNEDLEDGITRLLKERILSFGNATKLNQYTSSLLGKVTNAVAEFQANSSGKLDVTKLFGLNTIRRLLTRPGCGGMEGRTLDPGPPIEVLDNGKHVMRYWIEGLPNVGSAGQSLLAFMTGIQSWQKKLNLEISEETSDRNNANLMVSHEVLDADWSVLALTDIGSGPETGGVLRMMFDAAETSWTSEQLQATAAHELGHALGIRHADVRESDQLMNDTLDLKIKEPKEFDVRAAAAKGWSVR